MNLKIALKTIQKYERFLITTHVNPDPDALGSQLAMGMFLKLLGKKVYLINHDEVPARLSFLPGAKQIKACKTVPPFAYDAAVILDCGDYSRIGQVKYLIEEGTPIINVDHHVTNDNFGTMNIVDSEASSTCEVLYDLIIAAGVKLNKNLSMLLYAGIMTDTGSFRYENTRQKTHAIVSHLLEFKFSVSALYSRLYETIPLDDLQLFSKVVTQFEVLEKGKLVCVELPKRIVKQFSEDFDLRDAIFKFLRAINGIEVIVIFTEVEKEWTRVNFRSMNRVNVGKFANQFDGGGHKRASGCLVKKDLKVARKIVLREMKKVI